MPRTTTFCASLLLAFAMGSEVSAQDSTPPQIFGGPIPPPTASIGSVTLDRLAGKAIKIYKGSGGDTGANNLYHQPYIAYDVEDLEDQWREKCEGNPYSGGAFEMYLHIETSANDVLDAARSLLPDGKHWNVQKYPYRMIELYDAETKQRLWYYPKGNDFNTAVTTTFTRRESAQTGTSKISCMDLERYIDSGNMLEARVVLDSSVESSNVITFTYGALRDYILDVELDQVAKATGYLVTEGWTRVKRKESGKGDKSLLDKDVKLFKSALGVKKDTKKNTSIFTETESRETDTRQRWMNITGLRNLAKKAITHLRIEGYCVSSDCNPSELTARIMSSMENLIQKQTVKVLLAEPANDFAETYILLDDPETVKRLRKQAFERKGMEGGVNGEVLPKGAAKGELNFSSFSDENGVEWEYDGKEYVPTSIDMYYVNKDSFSLNAQTKIIETVVSGTELATMIIPVIRRDRGALDVVTDWKKGLSLLKNRSLL